MSKQTVSEKLASLKSRVKAKLEPILKKPTVQRATNKIVSKKHLYPSFFFPVMILAVVYAALGFWPIGNRSMLTLDMGAQYIFYFEQIRDILIGGESIIYTFERTLGGEFLGYYAYYLASPLSWIVCLFPAKMIVESVTLILMLKAGLSGLFFAYYLEKTRKTKDAMGLTMFSTMYALCAYAMAYQTNTMWMDALMLLPLVTLGLERLITDGKFKLFVITFAMTVWSNFYIGYMSCFYVLFYTVCFLFAHNDEEINGLNEAKHKLKSVIRVGICSLVSILMTAMIILSAYYALSFGKNNFQTSNFEPFLRFDFLDLFAKFFFGAYDTIRPDGTPNMYSGTLMLLMLPVYFVSKKVSARHKIAYGGLCGLFIAIMSVNTLDLVMHGFQMPVWLNYRYSFMFTFVLLTLAYRGYEYIKEVDSKFLFQTGIFLIFALMMMQKLVELTRYKSGGKKWDTEYAYLIDYEFIWASVILIGIYLGVLYFVKHSKSIKEKATTVLLLVVLVEAGLGAGVNWGHEVYEVGYGYRNSYVDFMERYKPTVDEVLESDTSFYRMEKNPYRRNNENLALNINGIAASTSTLNANVIELLNNMGFSASSHWAKYFCGNEVSDSLLGIKYVISEEGNHVSSTYKKTVSSDGLYIYENPHVLSIGFAAHKNGKDLILSQPQKISPFKYLNGMMTQLSGQSSLDIFTRCDYSITNTGNCSTRYSAGGVTISRSSSGIAFYEYTVIAKESGSIYMHFLSHTRNPVVKFYINGDEVSSVFDTDTNRIHNLGYYEKGAELKIRYEFDGSAVQYKTDAPIFVQVNEDELARAIDYLQKGNLKITDHSDTRIEGTITAEKDQFVFTSIPYDKYWNVYVDGERVETYATMDTLLAFDIGEGEHEIEMVYVSKPFYIGLVISLFGLGLFIALIVLERKLGYRVIPVWVRPDGKNTDCSTSSDTVSVDIQEGEPSPQLAEATGTEAKDTEVISTENMDSTTTGTEDTGENTNAKEE
ncbi:MAG: YfhO family protein [Clostridia bacterium]|nr:YfhO family protein [Clostridia bacterium]